MELRQAAPGALALVEDFLRTRNDIATTSDLDRWREQRGLAGEVTAETFDRAIRLREALRSLILANNGGPADAAAVRLVNAELVTCGPPQVTQDGSSLSVQWGTGCRTGDQRGGMFTTILAAVITAMTDGSWQRMKACAAEDCRYAFYDHTRNRSGRWCDVAGCGTNARMRAYRQRRHAAKER